MTNETIVVSDDLILQLRKTHSHEPNARTILMLTTLTQAQALAVHRSGCERLNLRLAQKGYYART